MPDQEEKSISQMILDKMDAMAIEPAGGGATSNEIKLKGVSAILGGEAERTEYLKLFADGPNALARLIPTDGTENDPEKRLARAYLIANSPCTPGTGSSLRENVTDILDYVLPPADPQPAWANTDPAVVDATQPLAGDPTPAAPVDNAFDNTPSK